MTVISASLPQAGVEYARLVLSLGLPSVQQVLRERSVCSVNEISAGTRTDMGRRKKALLPDLSLTPAHLRTGPRPWASVSPSAKFKLEGDLW